MRRGVARALAALALALALPSAVAQHVMHHAARHAAPRAGAANVTRVLAYGDSLTAGFYGGGRLFHPYASQLSRRLGGCVVDHIGASGFTAAEMRASLGAGSGHVDVDSTRRSWVALDAALQQAQPPYTHVVILAGTNDLGSLLHEDGRRTPEGVADDVQALHRAALSANARTAAVTVPQPAYEEAHTAIAPKRAAINDALRRFAAATPGVTLVDADAALPHVAATPGARRCRASAGAATLRR